MIKQITKIRQINVQDINIPNEISGTKAKTINNILDKNPIAQLWHKIDWKEANERVAEQQNDILQASIQKDWSKVYKLQRRLILSFPGRAVAVRKVITNKGGKTPGTDKEILSTPAEYYGAVQWVKTIVEQPLKYKAEPVRRIYIPKPGRKEKRPLGIPTIKDRIVQSVYHLAIDPVVEQISDTNSFGFRKERSTQDAINYFRNYMDKHWSPEWVLEADITKCFDNIDHDFLIRHTPICDKHVLVEWLKAGMIYNRKQIETEEGTPQGGIISPLLSNIALNGLEQEIKENPEIKALKAPKIKIIRYADDIVITGDSKETLLICWRLLEIFLAKRGLELNKIKTKITNIKEGIDLLGFNIRRQPWNYKLNAESTQRNVLIIKPSEKGIKNLKTKIWNIIKAHRSMKDITNEINPVLRGWAEHKRITPHARRSFFEIDNYIWERLRAKFLIPKGINTKIKDKFKLISPKKGRWGDNVKNLIYSLGRTTIKRLRLKKLDLNPYLLENREYFLKYKNQRILSSTQEKLFKKYKHLCSICGESLHDVEKIEIHHIVPVKKGKNHKLNNLIPLHRICHTKVTHEIN